jgi:hypothetical protein
MVSLAMQRHRYLIVQNKRRRLGKLAMALIYLAMFMLASLYFFGFFYWGSAELESEIRIEGR